MFSTTPAPLIPGLPSSVESYIRHGWLLVPIPPGTKGPEGPGSVGWNREERCLSRVEQLNPDHQGGYGLAHAYSGTMALDVDDWEMGRNDLLLQGIDLDALYTAPDAVAIESGNPGHGKLLYAMPMGLPLPSKKLISNKKNYLDFRCGTRAGRTCQDVLPPTIHPDTHVPYKWGGGGNWAHLPPIPAPLLTYWQSLIAKDKDRVIPSGGVLNTSWAEVSDLLASIPPDIDRDNWVAVGMALHWVGTSTDRLDEALTIWDEWSAKGHKYEGFTDLLARWPGFHAEGGRSIGTLFHIAKEHGWQRPTEDLFALFEGVEGVSADGPARKEPRGLTYHKDGLVAPPPDLYNEDWPALLSIRASEISTGVGCDPVVPLFASLAAICGVADARTRLILAEGYEVPPVLWLMTIGEPSEKKTPGSIGVFKAMYQIEAEDRPRYEQEFLKWEAEEAQYKKAREATIAHYTEAEALMSNDAPAAMPELAAQPQPLKLIVQDITAPKLIRNCSDRPEGVLCYLDEMNSWMRKICDPHSNEDRSVWVSSYEAGYYRMERVGDGAFWCDNFAVGIYGNIQPEALKKYIDALAEDGMLQRFVPCVLRPEFTRKGRPVPESFTSAGEWGVLLRKLQKMPPTKYRLSPAAATLYDEFQDWYYVMSQIERDLGADNKFMMALGKLEGLCGRLMLVFHMIDAAEEPFVPEATARQAITAIKRFVVPSLRRVLGESGGLASDNMDSWIADHILSLCHNHEEISLAELRKSSRRTVRDMERGARDTLIREAMMSLERVGWVVKDQDDMKTTSWFINPRLATTFSDHLERIETAKAARDEERRAMVETRTGVTRMGG